MKTVFVAIFALACLTTSQQAFASAANCLNWSSINVNSGHTSSACTDNNGALSGAECTVYSTGYCDVQLLTSCGVSYTYYGSTPTGKKCCVRGGQCLTDQQQQQFAQETDNTTHDSDLATVFGDRSITTFFGYVDSVLRSPNAGRTLIKDAKLDACIGFANLDNLVSNYPSDPYGAWSACTGSGYCGSVKNAYCTANSNQVCLDRCNCKYQSALVGLGYADPGCSNL